MGTAVVDSNVLIGARLASDHHHEEAREVAAGIDAGDLPSGRILDDVLSEVLNYVHTRAGHDPAIETLDGLQASVEFSIDRTTRSDFDAARSVFRQYEGLSFTDATIVAYMRRTGIEYLYSFDDDFDAVEDVTRLGTPSDPLA